MGGEGIGRIDGDVKAALFKAQVAELFDGRFGQAGDGFAPLGGQFAAGRPKFPVQFRAFLVEARQFRLALFELLQFAGRFRAKSDHVLQRRAVFALERMD